MQSSLKRSIFLLLTSPIYLFSLGGKPEVVKGSADYTVSGSSEMVRVSDKTILEYPKFNIEQHESTRFEQPTSKSTLLCRVKGSNPSNIRGKLEANGRLLFINPNGIIFSDTAHVSVGTLIASTLDIKNDDFLNDKYKFSLSDYSKDSKITNQGRIEAVHNAVLMAPHVINQGTITARIGKIALMGGEAITLDFDGDALIQFAVDVPLQKGHIEQAGIVAAQQVYMKLPMAQKAIRSVLNDKGIIEAHYIEVKDGVIRLQAGSKTEAESLHMESDVVHIAGALNVSGVCKIQGAQAVAWFKDNKVGHLDLNTNLFVVNAPLTASDWTTQVLGQYLLKSSILVGNDFLIFDAPVYLNAPHISISSTFPNGGILFQEPVESNPTNEKLTLSAGAGRIDFKKPVSLDHLDITSASDVRIEGMKAGEWTGRGITGITTVGDEVHVKNKIDLQGRGLDILHNVTVEHGPLILDLSGPFNSLEDITVTADSIKHTGTGDLFIGGKWVAKSGNITIGGAVRLFRDVSFLAPKGTIHLKKDVSGHGGLTASASNFIASGDTGRIRYLVVDAEESIKISNVGREGEELDGLLHLYAKGSIYFEGTDYFARGLDFKSDTSYEFTSGQRTNFSSTTHMPTLFLGGPIHLGESSTLNIQTGRGAIEISAVQGGLGSALNIYAPKSRLKIGRVQDVDRLDLNTQSMHFLSTIDAGSIHLTATGSVVVTHNLIAHTGDFIADAPLSFEAPEISVRALRGKTMKFTQPVNGNTKLTLHAPEGEIMLQGKMGEGRRFQQLNLVSQTISQYEPVISTGAVHYAAGRIFLGNDIMTDGAIILDGPVTLFHNEAMHLIGNRVYNSPVLLTSTLNSDSPTRALYIHNPRSLTQIKGAVGTPNGNMGALGELSIISGNVVFYDNVGGAAPGVIHRLKVNGVNIECKGATYHAGEQLWAATGEPGIRLTNEGAVEFKTTGLPLLFAPGTHIELDKAKALVVSTQGGRLDLGPIASYLHKPITINTGAGEVHLDRIGDKVSALHVEGREVLLSGYIKADQIFIEADTHIEYDSTQGHKIIRTNIDSAGTITLNSKKGSVGTLEHPLKMDATGKLQIGAKTIAYLEGHCEGQYPYGYTGNPAPRILFNGYEYRNYPSDYDSTAEAGLLKTLTPALSQSVSTSFMDGSVAKPRKAPIYYDASPK